MTAPNETTVTALRDLVSRQIATRWDAFAAEHPHLAGAVERTTLIESTVRRVTDDPAYAAALESAGRDEALLSAASRLLSLIESAVERALGL